MDILPDPRIREELSGLSGWPTIPQLFVDGELVGGCDIVTEMFESGELAETLGTEQPSRRGGRSRRAAAGRRRRRCRSSSDRRWTSATGSPSHERHYTVEQANAALPWVSERLARIRDALVELLAPESDAGAGADRHRRRRRLSRAGGGRRDAGCWARPASCRPLDIVLRDPQPRA